MAPKKPKTNVFGGWEKHFWEKKKFFLPFLKKKKNSFKKTKGPPKNQIPGNKNQVFFFLNQKRKTPLPPPQRVFSLPKNTKVTLGKIRGGVKLCKNLTKKVFNNGPQKKR